MMKSRDCLSFDLNHLNWIWNCLKRKTTFLQVSMISSTTAHRSSDKLPQASRESFSLQQSLRSLVCLCVALPVDDDNERGDLWLWRWDFNNVYLSTIESSIHCWSPSKVSDDDFHQKTDFDSVCSFLKHLRSGNCRKCDEIFAEISRNCCSDSPTLVSDSEFPSNESWACVSAAVTWLTSSHRRQFTRMFAMDPDCSLVIPISQDGSRLGRWWLIVCITARHRSVCCLVVGTSSNETKSSGAEWPEKCCANGARRKKVTVCCSFVPFFVVLLCCVPRRSKE